MAAVTRAVVRKDRDNRMTDKTNNSLTPLAHQPERLPDRMKNSLMPVANQPVRPPVRVKLRRVNANLATAYPPDGESKVWWRRLKKALGTTSSAFVNASLLQLQAAAQSPCGGISETATNAALALIEAAATSPRTVARPVMTPRSLKRSASGSSTAKASGPSVPIPRCRQEPQYSVGSPAIRNFAARTLSRASVTLKTSPSKPSRSSTTAAVTT
jgi:hypothetical protein